ncbi:spherulin-1B precursor [Dendryphion nanum]|uniref:Spherulin-1B n=1 Tax=Dendryphion nanum TaxID=256645 RepID=A0A9P9DGA5_9PLEO|nr:spherulin-1B precursor [Dendryphion nanum]
MSSTITKIFIGALATLGAVHALPQQQYATSTKAAVASATPVAPPAVADNSALIKDLRGTSSANKRFQRLLTVDGEGKKLLEGEDLKKRVVFDFNNAVAVGKGGATKAANIETFPILTDLGISTTLGFLNACGMNTPHVHPRATEFLTLTSGSLKFGYITENGLLPAGTPSEVTGSLSKYQGTVFPIGSIHYQFNPECEPAVFVASLNSEDPGTSQIAQNFFGLNADVVNATIGFPKSVDGKDIATFRKQIPANVALAIDACVKKCKL